MSLADRRVRIGQSPKEHHVLALGCWQFGQNQWPGQEDETSLATMAAAFDAGMDHFDTAAAYGRGHSEQVVGQFLAEGNRAEKVFLATKVNARAAEGILNSLDESLERLGVEAIDLFYLHWPRQGVEVAALVEGLAKAKEDGKILGVGVSNFSAEQLAEAEKVVKIDAHQFCYNLFWRFGEAEVIPYCIEHGIACVTYSSIAMGILTGKFGPSPQIDEKDVRANMVMFDAEVWAKLYPLTQELQAIADEVGRPMQDLAIQWVATRPGVTSVLVGSRNVEQARQNAAAVKGDLPEEILQRVDAIGHEAMASMPDVGNIFRYYP